MYTMVFGKFLGRAPPLGVAREALTRLWGHLGEFSVADMLNGFFLIRYSTSEMMETILTEGPWTVNGMVLHIIRWRPHFQASFEKLTSAILWVQLYNLSPEYWEMEHLKTVAAKIGKVIKVDETTFLQDRAKFARVCIEIDLNQPLKKGVWVNSEEPVNSQCFVSILYEKLPVFCYKCGVVEHGADGCKQGDTGGQSEVAGTEQPVPDPKGKGLAVDEGGPSVRMTSPQGEGRMLNQPEKEKVSDPKYGVWMTVAEKFGKSRRPAASRSQPK
ncbi:hypothetical protein J5N97_002587 [Dioscorea zingiberensis]|uniref:DUF4283 domain-containing protein n=1 Tax=Dioscorea zingiberensis TaxID=325984 RepID=A0A9D5D2J5_9LILI|nr:hypothetical protein J5N97_002587 [Dioscorea zingiberensis]